MIKGELIELINLRNQNEDLLKKYRNNFEEKQFNKIKYNKVLKVICIIK